MLRAGNVWNGVLSVKQRQTVSWWQLLILIPLVLSMTACGLIFSGDSVACEGHITESWHVTPPPSATNLEEHCQNGIQPSYDARFSMAAADAEAFMQDSGITDWETNSGAGVMEDEAARAGSYEVGTFGDGAYYVEVLIDTSDPQQYQVHYSAAFVD
jgi:hypothetical protein